MLDMLSKSEMTKEIILALNSMFAIAIFEKSFELFAAAVCDVWVGARDFDRHYAASTRIQSSTIATESKN